MRRGSDVTSGGNREAVGTHTRRVTAMFGALLVTLVVGAAGVAFACTVSAAISMSPNRGVVGTTVTVTGQAFLPAPVEIRWNTTGQVLATANGPSFSVNVRIPDAGRGVHYVTAMVDGERKAAEAFEVTVPTSPDGSSGGEQTGSDPARTETPSGASGAGFEPERSEPATAGPAQSADAPAVSTATQPNSAERPSSVEVEAATAAGTSRRGVTGTAARRAGAVVARPAPGSDSSSLSPVAPVAGETMGLPSPRTVGGDLWSGLDEGTVYGPSLDEAAPPAGQDSNVAAGLALLLAGAVAGLGALTVPAARRRRARV